MRHLSAVFTLTAAALLGLAPAGALARPSGVSGYSGQSGKSCTSCHGGGSTPTVTLSGPSSLAPGATGTFTLTVSGGPAKVAGFDVSGTGGALKAGTGSQLMNGELTHSSPLTMSGGTGKFTFSWTAPATGGNYTLYGAGLSANGDGGTGGDMSALATWLVSVVGSTPTVCATGATQSCYGGPAGTSGVGTCKPGTQTCANDAWGSCTGEIRPVAESCGDGLDNDCDGVVDDGCPAVVCTTGQQRNCYSGAAATAGVGTCKAGTQSCANNAWGSCTGEVVPVSEVCGDGLDNDCNGQVDNGCVTALCTEGQTRTCYAGPSGTSGVGTCKAGTQTCANSAWGSCAGEVVPATETCGDGLDNDCDGQVDDGCTTPTAAPCTDGDTRSCYSGKLQTAGRGECRAGTQTCTAGAWGACVGEVLPTAELCDGLDNDCDRKVDEKCGQPAKGCAGGTCDGGLDGDEDEDGDDGSVGTGLTTSDPQLGCSTGVGGPMAMILLPLLGLFMLGRRRDE